MSRRLRSAFTLIELLVVIAIIAILAAILFPVFAQAREAARKSTCLSNFKQIDLAIMQYDQDYDGSYPNCPWGGGNATTTSLGLIVQPYVKNSGIFKCPSDSIDTQPVSADFQTGVSYQYNVAYVSGQIEAQIQAPATMSVTWGGRGGDDFICDWMGLCGAGAPSDRMEGTPCNAVNQLAHGGGGTFAFLDGHAKFLQTGIIQQGLTQTLTAQPAGTTTLFRQF